jgi:hypothetical protein
LTCPRGGLASNPLAVEKAAGARVTKLKGSLRLQNIRGRNAIRTTSAVNTAMFTNSLDVVMRAVPSLPLV